MDITQQLLAQADLSLNLAQTRYGLALGAIVELSHAQLDEAQAEISHARAGYHDRLGLAVLRFQVTGT